MAEKQYQANVMKNTLCQTLNSMEWKYEVRENGLIFTFVTGENVKMPLFIFVDEEKSVMFIHSPLEYTVAEDMVPEVALATLNVNISILNGTFDFDTENRRHVFKIVLPYMDCAISEAACRYTILLACQTVDHFAPMLRSVAEGKMTAAELKKEIANKK